MLKLLVEQKDTFVTQIKIGGIVRMQTMNILLDMYIVSTTDMIYQLSALQNKINELVDAVNLLLDKSTES